MNQGHSQSISYVSIDVNLMVENVIQCKNGILIYVSASEKHGAYKTCKKQ